MEFEWQKSWRVVLREGDMSEEQLPPDDDVGRAEQEPSFTADDAPTSYATFAADAEGAAGVEPHGQPYDQESPSVPSRPGRSGAAWTDDEVAVLSILPDGPDYLRVLENASTQVGLVAVGPGRSARSRNILATIGQAMRASPFSVRNSRLALFTLALLVVVIGSTGLAAFTSPGLVGIVPFSLVSLPSASVGPTDPQTTGIGTPAATAPTDSKPTRQKLSPQGCVNGVEPPPGQGPYGPIYSTYGYRGVGNEIALTFDDGPNPVYTPQILAQLRSADVPATFFLVGHHAELYPDLVSQEWGDGHAIGNHTFNHDWIPGLSPDRLRTSLDKTAQVLRSATGDPCLWLFRAPYGQFIPPVRVPGTPTPGVPTPTPQAQVPVTVTQAWRVVHEAGYTPVNWDTDGKDWLLPGTQAIAQRIIAQLHPGAIILMHDGAPDNEKQDRSQTVAALPAVLAAIRARGLQPVTLPRMLVDAGLIKRPNPPPATPSPTRTPQSPNGAPIPPSILGSAMGLAWIPRSRRSRRGAAHARSLGVPDRADFSKTPSGGRPARRGAAGTGTG
jgi:peptidoglycan/xylan/chitin deacetylase (PgdA/CDA1 family)